MEVFVQSLRRQPHSNSTKNQLRFVTIATTKIPKINDINLSLLTRGEGAKYQTRMWYVAWAILGAVCMHFTRFTKTYIQNTSTTSQQKDEGVRLIKYGQQTQIALQ